MIAIVARQRTSSWASMSVALSLLVVLAASLAAASRVSAATTFVVNRIGDAADLNLANARCDVSSNTGNQCTLRAAIQEANDTPGADTINFNITSTSKTITPASPLPEITGTVTINGYSQPGTAANTRAIGTDAVLRIVLDGVNAGSNTTGLRLGAINSEVNGLVIQRFGSYGISMAISGQHVWGNYIGTNAAGSAARGNRTGISVTGFGHSVGGSSPASRNVISGNVEEGVRFFEARSSYVSGNYIGTNAAGTAALGNGDSGVNVNSSLTVSVGGTRSGEGNVISGNGYHGVIIVGSDSTAVLANRIGTSADGSVVLGNGDPSLFPAGVSVHSGNDTVIGRSGYGNVVIGNFDGIGDQGLSTQIEGNVIAGNTRVGVRAAGDSARIAENTIAQNVGSGVAVVAATTGVRITGNQMVGNGRIGIDLVRNNTDPGGVTANDTGDVDGGPNSLQNFPVLTQALRSNATTVTTVTGILNSTANTAFVIDVYLAAADPTGYGEGQRLLASQEITTNASGNKGFSFQLVTLAVGQQLTATATSVNATNTSEFAANLTVAPGS